MTCNCGARLYGSTEVTRGTCNKCVVVSPGSVTAPVGNLTAESTVTGNVTKQRKWDANNLDKVRAANATRKARWRKGRRSANDTGNEA